MEAKKRILILSEFSQLSSGYSVVAHEVLKRLHGQFDVAELASYGSPNDPRIQNCPWKVYPVGPSNEEENNEYNSHPINQFGRHLFEKVCLDFLPTHIFQYRDFWYDQFSIYSPLRKYYNLIWATPCDSAPQATEWINDYINLDACIPYTDWGFNLLKRQGKDKIKLFGTFPLGADFNVFQPISNKQGIKHQLGIDPNSLIVGMVARNQKRKLFPNLFHLFVKLLKSLDKSISDRTYLYLHTAWPDLGWNIPCLLKEFGLGNKVYFSYVCENCQTVFPSFFQDTKGICKRCHKYAARLVHSSKGIDNKSLSIIYNLFDIYIQAASNEGQAVTVVEAAACGVPVLVSEYSGTTDYIHKIDAIPIKVSSYNRESETGRYFAVFDEEDCLHKIKQLLEKPDSLRRTKGFNSSQLCKKYFSWDNSIKTLINCIDILRNRSWYEPLRLTRPNLNIPQLNNDNLIKWCLTNIVNKPELINSYWHLRLLRDLNWGFSQCGIGGLHLCDNNPPNTPYRAYTRELFIKEMIGLSEHYNRWEQQRYSVIKEISESKI